MTSSSPEEMVVLVVGSLGLDRLLTVPTYPEADTKIRTTAHHEYGGGNSGNTASAMAKLANAHILKQGNNFRIQLFSKVGDDAVGRQLQEELEAVGVDCSSPLFCRQPNRTTSLTTIIVSEQEHTRTCLHTPGTSGELEEQDVSNCNLDHVFQNVIHLHSDSRHTEAALVLAREARRRGIPVSVDVEKNRHSKALDQLLEVATIIFTNSQQIHDYLANLSHAKEQATGTKLHSSNAVLISNGSESQHRFDQSVQETLIHAIEPSFHFARWHGQTTNKEVVITKGKMGSLHVQCQSYHHAQDTASEGAIEHGATSDEPISPVDSGDRNHSIIRVHQDIVTEQSNNGRTLSKACYAIHSAGVLRKPTIVDTTGAGDTYIGAYLLMQLHCGDTTTTTKKHSIGGDIPQQQLCLDFAAWVAGKKLGGPGGRVAVPTGEDVDNELGTDWRTIRTNLAAAISSFGDTR